MKNKHEHSVVLGGIGYNVSVQDGQVIFEQTGGIWGVVTRFAFEKKRDINNTPGIWYMVEFSNTYGRISADDIKLGFEWCCENFGGNFEDIQ